MRDRTSQTRVVQLEIPVSDRTSISACLARSPRSRLSTVPRNPATKDSGIDTIPGLLNGNTAKSRPGKIDVGLPETTGDRATSAKHENSPPYMPHSVPRVLNRRQNSEYSSVDRLAEPANANASPTRNATFWPLAMIPPAMA